jgi:prepilin-type N-terminal cleavage/methylation domain-containing protein
MRSPPAAPRPCAGFTLIELMCVLAILLLLFAMSFGVGGAVRQKSRQQQCRQNLQFVYQALRVAAAENADRYPVATNAASADAVFQALVPKYSSRVDVFRCPGRTRDPFTETTAATKRFRNHFAYAQGRAEADGAEHWLVSDAQVDTRAKAVGAPLFADTDDGPGSNHGKHGGSVLFLDGRAEASPARAKFEITVPPGGAILNPNP